MRFRTILVVSDVAIREDTQITLSYQSTHPIAIAIEKDDVGDRRSATVTAVTQFDADRYQAVFAALEAGRLPHDAKPYMAGDTLVQPGSRSTDTYRIQVYCPKHSSR